MMSKLYSALIKCKCGYEHLTKQTTENMTVWAGEKLKKIHEAECNKGTQLILGGNEREED